MLLTVWLFRRFPMQSWFENRLAWLCPRDLVKAGEALAPAHPYRFSPSGLATAEGIGDFHPTSPRRSTLFLIKPDL